MEYVSSDTNVWVDFFVIDGLSLPFQLPYQYIMCRDAMEDELLTPGFQAALVDCGLVGVDLTEEEFYLAEDYGPRYPKLSIYDRIALAIAKCRQIILLTGDLALRKAAQAEGVSILGTIGILDQLYEGRYIKEEKYLACLLDLQRHNGAQVRLPKRELQLRIQRLEKIKDQS